MVETRRQTRKRGLRAAKEEHLPQGDAAPSNLQEGNVVRASLYIKIFRLVVRFLLRILFRVRVIGLQNLPRRAVIICSNHLGWADGFLILCFFLIEPRIYVLGYSLDYMEEEGAKKFRKSALDSLQLMVPLRIDRPLEALRTMRGILERGGSMLLFVEGTYMGAQEGRLQEVQSGAAQLSQMTGVPLVPVGMTGTKELWFRRTLTVRVGEAITPDSCEGSLRERVQSMTTRLTSDLQRLIPGDHERSRAKPLRKWLTGLFYEEEPFERPHKPKET